jgi:hypothetical protein
VACSGNCDRCQRVKKWWLGYHDEVDNLVFRTNLHRHYESTQDHKAQKAKEDWRGKKKRKVVSSGFKFERKGCLTQSGVCRARFPREVVDVSEVAQDGHVRVRHKEPMVNTVNPVLTYPDAIQMLLVCYRERQ